MKIRIYMKALIICFTKNEEVKHMISNYNWPQPEPLGNYAAIHAVFPINCFNDPLGAFVKALAANTCTDVAMPATVALSAVSYALSGVFCIIGRPGHKEPLVIDSLVVSDPSTMKTPINNAIKKSFDSFLANYNKNSEMMFLRNEANRVNIEKQIYNYQKQPNFDPNVLAELYKQLNAIRNYRKRTMMTEDCTPQMLALQLQYDRTLLILSSESGLLGNFNGRYDSLPNMDLLLKSYSGETYSNSTIKRGTITLDKPYISISLMTQPYMWNRMYATNAFRDSGFIARLIYCFPDNSIKKIYNTPPIPDNVTDNFNSMVVKMLNIKFQRFEAGDFNENTIHLDNKASALYSDFYDNYIQEGLKKQMAICVDWGGKYHGLVLRIAGIIHCMECYDSDVDPDSIDVNELTMEKAIIIGKYYEQQAIIAYNYGEEANYIISAKNLLEKVKGKQYRIIKQNDLFNHTRCKLYKNANEFNLLLEYLIDMNYVVREEIPPTNGATRTGHMLYFNPNIFI